MSDPDSILTLTHATERDIDLLLVEELKCSRDFVAFVLQLVLGKDFEVNGIQVVHSKRRTYNRREIDICLEVRSSHSGEKIAIFIENKLDATEQPEQAESYLDECRLYLVDGRASQAHAMLVCPRDYHARWKDFADKFHSVLHYEDVSRFLATRAHVESGETARRLAHRRELIEQAITKARRGYEPIPIETIGTFNEQYIELLEKMAPEIRPGPSMLKKEGNPSESVSMIFDHKTTFPMLDSGVLPRRFAHELGHGQSHRANYVAATYAKWGAHHHKMKEVLERDLEGTGLEVEAKTPTKQRPTPGMGIRLKTPAVDNQADFSEQIDLISEGIRQAQKLRQWVINNGNLIKKWSDLYEELEKTG